MTPAVPEHHPLLALIDLCHAARSATTVEALGFLLVNDTQRLVAYRQAALWQCQGGIQALSGVMEADGNAPYAQWLHKVCNHLHGLDSAASAQDALAAPPLTPRPVQAGDLPPELAEAWQAWLPAQALWLPLAVAGPRGGGLLLAADAPWPAAELALLAEWGHAWQHAWRGLQPQAAWSPRRWLAQLPDWLRASREQPWWRRRPLQLTLGALLVLLFPVRLSVLAPGELVPARPAVLRAPMEGVISQFHVRPNEAVRAGQALFSFDEAALASRLEAARQALATAEAEYRQFAQLALNDGKSKGQLAVLAGKIGEKQAEADYLARQFERSHVVAPQDGIALFDDPAEWVGRPVQTGERIMRVAAANEVEIEAWISIGDAIPLEAGAPVQLYLSATPFRPVAGHLRYLNHDAVARPDGSYAYRARARLEDVPRDRIGLKGTAKLHGQWTTLIHWVLRRPLASIRQFIAF